MAGSFSSLLAYNGACLPEIVMKPVVLMLLLLGQPALSFTWPVRTAEEAGLDATHIDAAIAQIQSGVVGQIRSLIIIKDGYLVTRRYFNNMGEKRPVYSVTKSVGSALLGIAKYQGADIQTTASVMDYLPQYSNINNFNQANQITLHDLLTQRHGYNWDEWTVPYGNPNNPVSQMLNVTDWYRFALQWPIIKSPDEDFAYSTGHSSLMSPILQNRTGRDVYDFARDELFTPLDISDTHWELINGGGTQGQGITRFPFGLEPLGFGLWLTPLDMAKIGELYRLGGVWQGERLLAEDWVTQSVQKYSDGLSDPDVFTDEHSGYGYQWWVIRLVDQLNRPFEMYYANGYGRQYIFVLPEVNTVIVSTADDYTRDGPGMGTVMRENLLLAFAQPETVTFPLSSDLNGSWFNPQTNGQGINIEILDGGQAFVGYWYTYEPAGGQQRWFTLQGTITFAYESVTEQTAGEFDLTRLTAASGACLSNNKTSQLGPHLY
jgi:CubicO group peptidase (beta-lactamase class C family)